MASSASDLVKDLHGLITLPDVYLRINRLLDDPSSSSSDIAKVVSQDPAFTIRLLKVANSSMYNFSSRVDTVARAVSIIGTAQIRNLALSMSVSKSFEGLPNELVSMTNFWRHSLLCALASRHLGGQAGRCDRDAMFTAGLLHDIGELVLFNREPEKARAALMKVLDSQDELVVSDAERELFGFDHADVGGELAREWNLPPLLEECINHHHNLAGASRHKREVAIVHIGNVLALMAELKTVDPEAVEPIDPRAWEMSGLETDCIAPTVAAVGDEIDEVERLFMGKA